MKTFAEKFKGGEAGFNKSGKSQNAPSDSTVWSSVSPPFSNFQIQRKADCACGGDCPTCQEGNSNLSISQPNDASEIEADVMADKVMRMKMPEPAEFSPTKNSVQKKESRNDSTSVAPPIVQDVISSSGKSLDKDTRQFMESRMGHDFSNVQVHTDSKAAESAQSVNALAYTSGNHIVFNSGQYEPDTEKGKRLLAHELVHTVQQNSFVQRQTSNAPVSEKEIIITEELIDISAASEFPITESPLANESEISTANDLETNEPPVIVQRTPAPAAPVTPVAPIRKNLIFIMGTTGGFYEAANKFFRQHHPEAEVVKFEDRSLSGIFAVLRAKVSDTTPAGNIYIVSHANQNGTLSFPLDSKDKDRVTTFGELKVALRNNASMFKLAGGIDDNTFIHIKGCNIGRNVNMLNTLDEAFGGKDKVDAPTHKQGYEFHSKKIGKKITTVSSEFFNDFILEYAGKPDKSTEDLIADFKEKYSKLGYEDHEWKMMVMGAKMYDTSVIKDTKDKKNAIDKETKDKKKDVDKTDKNGLKEIDKEANAAKAEVDVWTKKMKSSAVAAKSPGVKKEVDLRFTATLYDDIDPSINLSKALHLGKARFDKELQKKGFTITKCTSISPNPQESSKFDFEYLAENKKTGDTLTLTSTTAKFPKSDEEGNTFADELLEENVVKKPESEVARKDMYSWRIEKKKTNDFIKITAFLEMTKYSINVDLKEKSGDKIDPAAKKDDDFYYGESDFK